ncbi:hypothetical protein C6P61_14595 [Malikia spinosa]|uniref:Uncharacterized protein n=1 Tax=Malikia spinosa TaxID=86180 RepID=A0A2S9KBC1_9BURK|nr:hypothetical protein [Malikia spinosa]PRD67727.1 hypothetical protein C6P61_14595 [Malikia spinosa]
MRWMVVPGTVMPYGIADFLQQHSRDLLESVAKRGRDQAWLTITFCFSLPDHDNPAWEYLGILIKTHTKAGDGFRPDGSLRIDSS